MVELSVIRDLVAIFGVIAGFSYYVLTVRASQRNQQLQLETRQAQLMMQIASTFSEEFSRNWLEIMSVEWSDFDDYDRKIMKDKTRMSKFMNIGFLLESVGVLVYKKMIDIELVDHLFSSMVITYWEKFGPMEIMFREHYNNPKNAEWTEYLYNEVMRIAIAQHPEIRDKRIAPLKVADENLS